MPDFSHIDPDLVPILQDLQSQISAIPAAQAFDPTSINNAIAALQSAVAAIPTPDLTSINSRLAALEADFTITPQTVEGTVNSLTASVKALSPADMVIWQTSMQAFLAVVSPPTTPPPPPPPPPNLPPVVQTIPTVTFIQGQAKSVSMVGFFSDPNNDPLTLTLQGSLPTGVTFNGTSLVYDGVGSLGVSTVSILADDGHTP